MSMDTGVNNQLQSFVDRIERLEAEKAAISVDIRDVYAETKSNGFNVKIIKKIIAMRKKDGAELQEEQALIATYMGALGMLAGTPLGDAAMKRDLGR